VIARNISVGTSTVVSSRKVSKPRSASFRVRALIASSRRRRSAARRDGVLDATHGHARRTLALLAGEMVRLTAHESLSSETVRRRLAENELKPWQKKMWCIPKVDVNFVAQMEDVLDLYAEPPNKKLPVSASMRVRANSSASRACQSQRSPAATSPSACEILWAFESCSTTRDRSLPDIRAGRGAPNPAANRIPLHAEARKLAEHQMALHRRGRSQQNSTEPTKCCGRRAIEGPRSFHHIHCDEVLARAKRTGGRTWERPFWLRSGVLP